LLTADIDLERLGQERMRTNTFGDCVRAELDWAEPLRILTFTLDRPAAAVALERVIERFPYVPADAARLREECYEAYNIQVQGLAQRLATPGIRHAVLGVSGGLDCKRSSGALLLEAHVI
jgi:NAD+ synthase (glutamine-hydrolysing)